MALSHSHMRYHHICLASFLRFLTKQLHPTRGVVAFQNHRRYLHHRLHPSHSRSVVMQSSDGSVDSDGNALTQEASSELEIEKKFSIPDAQSAERIDQTLASLGFKVSRKEEFVDWYFDLPAPYWHFSLQDCWFRYREKKIKVLNNWGWRGAWQVKRGKNIGGDKDGMTVYEELQGKDAKSTVLDMICNLSDAEDCPIPETDEMQPHYDGFDVPHLAGAERLVPFARLETFRTCYESTTTHGEFTNLKVDIDKTNFGHMVGEVEAVFDDMSADESHVEEVKEKISKLVDLISSQSKRDDASSVAIGKLEFYLINHKRDHYDACVRAGVI